MRGLLKIPTKNALQDDVHIAYLSVYLYYVSYLSIYLSVCIAICTICLCTHILSIYSRHPDDVQTQLEELVGEELHPL